MIKKTFRTFLTGLYKACIVLFVTILIYIISSIFFFSFFKVNSMSMYPTLEAGDKIIVLKSILGARLYNIFNISSSKPLCIIRVPGMRNIKRNDVVVFNYPYEVWNKWDKMKMNFTTYYVKRCIAIPGDSLYIENGMYKVRGINKIWGNISMQKRLADLLLARENSVNTFYNTLPYDSAYKWTIRQFGPLYIPKKGQTINLDRKNFLLYKNIIEWETQKQLDFQRNKAILNHIFIFKYKFEHDYYFMAGDNVTSSVDSRYWGLVPKEFIVGKAWIICKSISLDTGEMRWDRFLTAIH